MREPFPKPSYDPILEKDQTMRTNIPHGMSQNNRAHPFFILLRKFADTEEKAFRRLAEYQYRCLLFYSIASFLFLLTALCNHYTPFLSIPVFGLGYWFRLRTIEFLPNLTFPKVNAMLMGDDYSGATLNYETVINLIGNANWNIGKMESLYSVMHLTTKMILGMLLWISAIFLFEVVL